MQSSSRNSHMPSASIKMSLTKKLTSQCCHFFIPCMLLSVVPVPTLLLLRRQYNLSETKRQAKQQLLNLFAFGEKIVGLRQKAKDPRKYLSCCSWIFRLVHALSTSTTVSVLLSMVFYYLRSGHCPKTSTRSSMCVTSYSAFWQSGVFHLNIFLSIQIG